MARLPKNPDRDFSAGNGEDDQTWQDEPTPPLDDLLNDTAISERIGKLISEAMRRSFKPRR